MRIRCARFRPVLLAAAAAAVSLGADAPSHRTFRPVAPEPEYYKLKHLMGDGMMPNYKALWSGFRRDDETSVKQSLAYIEALARDSGRYPLPEAARADGGADFRSRMSGLASQANAFSSQLPQPRDAVSARILSIYGTCQQCHEKYAPEEGRERRKYSPPPA
jgi:cytochrome c556